MAHRATPLRDELRQLIRDADRADDLELQLLAAQQERDVWRDLAKELGGVAGVAYDRKRPHVNCEIVIDKVNLELMKPEERSEYVAHLASQMARLLRKAIAQRFTLAPVVAVYPPD